MKINFYLARAAAKQQSAIFATAAYNGHRMKIYTSECIDPKHWNAKTHSARSAPKFIEAPEFNRRLDSIRSLINSTYLKYKNDHGTIPEPKDLAKLVAVALGRTAEIKQTLLSYFDSFIDRQASGLRMNPKTGKPIKPASAKFYRHTYNCLEGYIKATGKTVDFATADLEFYNNFTRYLTEKKISLNTAGSHIKKLKAVLSEANAHGIKVNQAFNSSYFVVQSETGDNIALSEMELSDIESLDLAGNKRLDAVRDLFLIGCYTGLRYSDYSTLTPASIQDGFIKITQLKTSRPVSIPIHPVVQKLFDKYDGNLPSGISNQKTNAYLKEIGQMVPSLAATTSKRTTRGGMKVTATKPRWQMLSSHAARRTFATLQYLGGIPPLVLMAITGHKTESSFLKYIKVSSDEHAQKMKELWAASSRAKMKAV